MRDAFISTITDIAERDPDVFLLTGDLGFSVFEKFRDAFPDRFFNAGVAEQNMIGVAAGLALKGKKVFVYSIVPFATMRCFEQIRNDICAQGVPVTIVGMGAGLHYGSAGATHHGLEDISVMRSLPHMRVISPASAWETEEALRAVIADPGPAYIRLSGVTGAPLAAMPRESFTIGKAITLRDGGDLTIFATGSIVGVAMQVASELAHHDMQARVVSMHTVKPIDLHCVRDVIAEGKPIIALEEHSETGGLGSAVAEIVAESRFLGTFKRVALPSTFVKENGSRSELCERYGLSVAKIVDAVHAVFEDGK